MITEDAIQVVDLVIVRSPFAVLFIFFLTGVDRTTRMTEIIRSIFTDTVRTCMCTDHTQVLGADTTRYLSRSMGTGVGHYIGQSLNEVNPLRYAPSVSTVSIFL